MKIKSNQANPFLFFKIWKQYIRIYDKNYGFRV